MTSGIGGPGGFDYRLYEQLEGDESHAPAQTEAITETTGEPSAGPAAPFTEPAPDYFPAEYAAQRSDKTPDYSRNAPQVDLPPAPQYGAGGEPEAARLPTSRMRRVASAFTMRPGARTTNPPGDHPAGEALPPLPAAVRQGQAGGSAVPGPSGTQAPPNLAVPEEKRAKKRGENFHQHDRRRRHTSWSQPQIT